MSHFGTGPFAEKSRKIKEEKNRAQKEYSSGNLAKFEPIITPAQLT